MRLAYALLLIGGCAVATTEPSSDGKAQTAAGQPIAKTALAGFAGLYVSRATGLRAGDVPSLELRVTTKPGLPPQYDYIRSRCYHASCSERLPETDTYDLYTSSSGKTYVRFWSFTAARDANDILVTTPKIADVYEIKATSSGIKLRKSATSRWVTLYATTPAALCTGTWSGTDCTCGAGDEFVAGAGGCIPTPGSNESNCDASDGSWTDDDATLIGSYCMCGIGRYDDATGSCATI